MYVSEKMESEEVESGKFARSTFHFQLTTFHLRDELFELRLIFLLPDHDKP